MFIGEYRHSLDSKNRLIIPAKYRDALGQSFIVTKGSDRCLTVYSIEQFSEIMNSVSAIPSTMKEQRDYVRMLATSATECTLDNQGRIQLPAILKQKASLNKNAVIAGVWDHIEIWPEEIWTAYEAEASENFESNGEKLTGYMK